VIWGDSWVDYPFHGDITEALQTQYDGYTLGDKFANVFEWAYLERMQAGFTDFAKYLSGLGARPRVIFLSGGGNDSTAKRLGALLNYKSTGLPTLNPDAVKRHIALLQSWYRGILEGLQEVYGAMGIADRPIPVLLHGYDHPFPGIGGGWLWPWFEEAGRTKGEGREAMETLINLLNEMQIDLATKEFPAFAHHVEVRGTMAELNPANPSSAWLNELHPTWDGFVAVTAKIDQEIQKHPVG